MDEGVGDGEGVVPADGEGDGFAEGKSAFEEEEAGADDPAEAVGETDKTEL